MLEPNWLRACYECGSNHPQSGSLILDRIRAQGPEENRQNQVAANNEGQGRGNQARGRAFMLGAEEARQDPNIVTGTFTLNNHFATTFYLTLVPIIVLFPLLSHTSIDDLEPSDLGFRYEIEIATAKLVETDQGMDWLSNHKAEVLCHDKVVRIPLLYGKVLRVLGERSEEKARLLMSAKPGDKKQEEIVVVRDFPKVFSDDLTGLPPLREIEFRIELIPGPITIARSFYHLARSELEELSGQLKEL
ncbi:hypothetical protein Tco_0030769 [Tanacetum coccineum]